jgi:hypothetical protein
MVQASRERRELRWRLEWRVQICCNSLKPPAKIRRVDAVWCSATSEQLVGLDNAEPTLCMERYPEWSKLLGDGTIA